MKKFEEYHQHPFQKELARLKKNLKICRKKILIWFRYLTLICIFCQQQLGTDIYGYEALLDYQVNKYVAPDGSQPFLLAPDWQRAVASWKKA